jgi:RNA polymerase sigma factor (sigma-70 family)
MARGVLRTVLGRLRQTVGPAEEPQSDADLLARYRRGEAEAFEAIVRRHGPMVWGVCCRSLWSRQDAEDVFQATFLVLVRKAGALSRPERLGPWLHGVATRTAARARCLVASRRRREQALAEGAEPMSASEALAPLLDRELGGLLDEAIERLPDRFRQPVVLCHLQGLTAEEAAARLGCPRGTVLSRLARARQRLRAALARRGVEVPAGLAGLPAVASPPVPVALVAETVQQGLLFAAGACGASASVTVLVKGVMQGMLLHKLKVATVAVVFLGLAGTGLGFLAHQAGPGLALAQPAGGDAGPGAKAAKGAAEAAKKEADSPPAKTGAEKKPATPFARAQEIRERLANTVEFAGYDDEKTSLIEALDQLAKIYRITFDVNEKAFKDEDIEKVLGMQIVGDSPIPPMKTSLSSVLRKILTRVPAKSGAVFLIRKDMIEITTGAAVREELGLPSNARLFPLVWEVFEDRDLTAAFDDLANASGYNVVVDAKVKETVKKTQVTARLANVPVDTAVRLLADMAELDVVLLDNVFYVTTPDKAKRLQEKTRRPAPTALAAPAKPKEK